MYRMHVQQGFSLCKLQALGQIGEGRTGDGSGELNDKAGGMARDHFSWTWSMSHRAVPCK